MKQKQGDYDLIKDSLMCFDLSKVKIYGNSNSQAYSQFKIYVDIKEDYCENF